MKTSIWYHTAEKQPDRSGHYLSYRGWGMGGGFDGASDYGYLYYHKKTDTWYEYEGEVRKMHPNKCIVYYWTDADPRGWVDNDPPVVRRKEMIKHPALEDAWKNVLDAIEKYKILEALIK